MGWWIGLFLFSGKLLHGQAASHPGSEGSSFWGGISQVNITPPAGYSHYRGVSTGVHDSLYAKTVVVGDGDSKIAVVVCDLLYMDRDLTIKARSLASEKTGIPFSNILIAATHNHTGPSYNDYIDELNKTNRPATNTAPTTENGKDYPDWLAEQIARSVILANEKLVQITIDAGTRNLSGLAYNRRFIMKDGKARMNPGTNNPDILHVEGPVDSTLTFLLLKSRTGQNLFGCLSNFALHADTFGGTEFSGDYPGFLARFLAGKFSEDFISVFANGACGDINHVDVEGGSPRKTSQEIGETIGRGIIEELSHTNKIGNGSVRAASEFAYVPLQEYTEQELQWALAEDNQEENQIENPYEDYAERDFLTVRRGVKIRHLHAMRTKGEAIPPTIGNGPWKLPLEVQVFRLGDEVAIVGLPGEIFTELSMSIKKASPFKYTIVIECTNSLLPYVPTREDYARGDYEVVNSRLVPGGGEMLAETAIRLLEKISGTH